MDKILKVLKFLNLLDSSEAAISLTNVGLVAILGKIILAKDLDWPSLVALVGMLSNYMHKRSSVPGEDIAPK